MPILATLEPKAITVEAGGAASVRVRIRNRGTIVDAFELRIVGPAAGWASAEPAMIRLFPDEEGVAEVTFRPPRSSTPVAGTYPFGVSIRPSSDPASSVVEEGRVGVNPFVDIAADIVPATSEARSVGQHEITVANRGNATADVSVQAHDSDRKIEFALAQERIGVAPGRTEAIKLQATIRKRRWVGSPKRIPFTVNVVERTGPQQALSAAIEQLAIVPTWARSVAGVLVAAILLVAIVPKLLNGTNTSSTESGSPGGSAGASQVAVGGTLASGDPGVSAPVSPSPAASDSPAPSASDAPSPSVIPSASPVPTVLPSATVVPPPTAVPPTAVAPTQDTTPPSISNMTAIHRELYPCGTPHQFTINVVATDGGGVASVTLHYKAPGGTIFTVYTSQQMYGDGIGDWSATVEANTWSEGDVSYFVDAIDGAGNQSPTLFYDDTNSIHVNGCLH